MQFGPHSLNNIVTPSLKIVKEGQITKCPTCHQDKNWDIERQYCDTCKDIAMSESVLRLNAQNAITVKQQNDMTLTSDELEKSKVKQEMQIVFAQALKTHLDYKYSEEQIKSLTSEQVWDIHKDLLKSYAIFDANNLRKNNAKTKFFNYWTFYYAGFAFLGFVRATLLWVTNIYLGAMCWLSFGVLAMVCLIRRLSIELPSRPEYLAKYENFERLHGKNARFL